MNGSIIPFPILTVEAMSVHDWEPALTLRLPAEPSAELLDEARYQVMAYLHWLSVDAAPHTAPEELRREINRAAARLIEICFAKQDAEARSREG